MMGGQTGIVQPAPRPTARICAAWLDRAGFGALALLAAGYAFELRHPVLQTGAGLTLTSVELLLALVLILWLAAKLASRAAPDIPRAIIPSLPVWIGSLNLSALLAPSYQGHAFLFISRVLAGAAIGWAAYDLARDGARQRTVIAALVGCGMTVAVLGLVEGTGAPQILEWLARFKVAQTRIGDMVRISSTLSYATIAAMILEMALPPALALALIAQRVWQRWLAGAAVLVLSISLVLTLSRAGILALLGALGLMAVYGIRWKHRALTVGSAIAGTALAGLVALVLVWNPLAALRLSTESEQTWYRAAYEVKSELRAQPNQVIETPIRLTNTGARAWEPGSDTPFLVSYHLYGDADEAVTVTYDGLRSPLPRRVEPGESVEVMAAIAAPAEAGIYRIEWDLLQEHITWFSWKGAPVARSRLIVAGAPVSSGIEPPLTRPPTDIRVTRPTLERSVLWGAAIQMALDRPLLGIGPDNFRWRYGEILGLDAWNTDIHANSLYLEWLTDTGVIGLAAFAWFSWKLLNAALPAHAGPTDDRQIIRLALAASLVAWYVHGLFDYFYEFTPTYVAFWLMAGLALRLGNSRANNAHRN